MRDIDGMVKFSHERAWVKRLEKGSRELSLTENCWVGQKGLGRKIEAHLSLENFNVRWCSLGPHASK